MADDGHLDWLALHERADLGQDGLRTLRPVRKGAILARFTAKRILDRPARLTLQVDDERHVELDPPLLARVNHGCDPNVAFAVDDLPAGPGELVALRDITAGEELTAFYPATEWQMAEPFPCNCGSLRCRGRIAGAVDLPSDDLARYRTSAYVRRRLAGRS